MIKVIFFSQNSKFRVRNSHFSHRPKQRYARPAPVSGPTDPKRQNRSPSSIFGHSRSLRGFRPPPSAHSRTRIFPKPVLISETSSIHALQQISISIRETFPHKREVRPPLVPRTHSLSRRADGSVPAKHRLPRAEEAGSREGWKNRVQSLSLSRRRHLRRGPAGPQVRPRPKSITMIYRSKAPLRIGLAGGGTDVSPYSDLYGGAILNATVSLYAHATIEPTDEPQIVLRALDRNQTPRYELQSELPIDGVLAPAQGNIQPCRVAVRPDRKRLLAQHVRGRAGRLGTRLVVDARRRDTRSVRPVAEAAARKLRRRAAGLSDRARRAGHGRRQAGPIRRHFRRIQLHGVLRRPRDRQSAAHQAGVYQRAGEQPAAVLYLQKPRVGGNHRAAAAERPRRTTAPRSRPCMSSSSRRRK